MRWEHMAPVGDGERVRHCGECNLNVHNLSGMTRHEAEAFLKSVAPGQRVCGGFYRRADGSVMTRDCPVGLRLARLRLAKAMTRMAAAAALVFTGVVFARSRDREVWAVGLAHSRPFSTLCEWVRGNPAPTTRGLMMLGEVCAPPPAPSQ